jgi:hypothetical protein
MFPSAKPGIPEAAALLTVTAALVALLGPGATRAQAQEAPSWRGNVGVTVSPAFRQYFDVPPQCCPVGGWVTIGSGAFRLQVDHVRSHRRSTGSGGYPFTYEGREASVQRVSLTTEVQHESNLLVSWRALDKPAYSLHLLFGAFYRHMANRFCVAFDGPLVRLSPAPHPWAPDDIVFRADLTADEKRRCEAERPRTSQVVRLQAGMALDVPIGDRFFARAEGRLVLLDFRVGAGIRF